MDRDGEADRCGSEANRRGGEADRHGKVDCDDGEGEEVRLCSRKKI